MWGSEVINQPFYEIHHVAQNGVTAFTLCLFAPIVFMPNVSVCMCESACQGEDTLVPHSVPRYLPEESVKVTDLQTQTMQEVLGLPSMTVSAAKTNQSLFESSGDVKEDKPNQKQRIFAESKQQREREMARVKHYV